MKSPDPIQRLFIAVALPPPLRSELVREQRRLEAKGVRAVWVHPSNMHLTLHFLGNIAPVTIDEIAAECRRAAEGLPAIQLQTKALTYLPSDQWPRVLATKITGDVMKLENLHRRLETQLRLLRLGADDRPYKPHVTIGRFRRRSVKQAALLSEGALSTSHRSYGAFVVDSFEVLSSELRPAGAVYESVAKVNFPRLT